MHISSKLVWVNVHYVYEHVKHVRKSANTQGPADYMQQTANQLVSILFEYYHFFYIMLQIYRLIYL